MTSKQPPARRMTVYSAAGALVVGVGLLVTACGSSAPDPSGVWASSDGSATKTIRADGACSGMYYNAGKPLDIGGPMTCTFSSEKSADGTYALVVAQPPNQKTMKVSFTGKNTMQLIDPASGKVVVTLTRR